MSTTIAEKCRQILPTITKRPALLDNGDGSLMQTQHFGIRADFPDGREPECLSKTFSKQYHLPEFDDMVSLIESAANAVGTDDCITTIAWQNEAWTAIVGPSSEQRRELCDGANLWQRTILRLPFNGRQITFSSGLYCDLCKNLQMVKSEDSATIKINHSSSLRSNMIDLVDTARQSLQRGESMIEALRRYDAQEVTISDFVSRWYADTIGLPSAESSDSAKTRFTNATTAIVRRLASEARRINRPTDLATDRATLWQVCNAITGYIQHDATRRKIGGRSPNEVERALAAVADTKSAHVWDMAADLAS